MVGQKPNQKVKVELDTTSVSIPAGWTNVYGDAKGAEFSNASRGLTVVIRAVYRASKRRHHFQTPSHYTIQLQQDWFSKGLVGERNMGARVDTADEALTVAQEFMREFTREMNAKPLEEVQAVHASVDNHETADDVLTSEAAAEALADAAGYSDDLLMSVVVAETNDQYEYVAHRDGATVTSVAGEGRASGFDKNRLKQIHAVFPVDTQASKHVLDLDMPIWIVIHLDEYTIFRFLFADARETDVVLERGTEILSPAFGNTIANVLEEKW